jgi:chemotaxis protein methyltransferase CheR
MRITDFDVYKELLKEKSGLVIAPDQTYMLESRLGPISKKWGYPSIEALTQALQGVPDKALIADIIEVMANHETSFFRDLATFDLFRNSALPYLAKARASQKKLRIWSAAAASGQEPYSIALTLKEQAAQIPNLKPEIIASDISIEVLEQAKLGVYSQFEAQRGMPIHTLIKYFTQDGQLWKIKDDVRKMVEFRDFNLLDDMTPLGSFDVIFCCNVLCDFDDETASDILMRLTQRLAPDGFLFLGSAEAGKGKTADLTAVADQRGVLVPKSSPYLAMANSAAPLATGAVSA